MLKRREGHPFFKLGVFGSTPADAGAEDDAALQLVELLPKGDHADEDDALLEAEGVLVLVVRAGLVAGASDLPR